MDPSAGDEVRGIAMISKSSDRQATLLTDQLRAPPGPTAATLVNSTSRPSNNPTPDKPKSLSKRGKQPNRLMKELAAFNEEPKHKVAMTQENLEIAGVWETRYSSKVMNHKDPSRLPSPPKNLNVNRMVKDQILPKNKLKDQNAFGGAGVPVTHALDDSAEGSEDIAGIYESSGDSFVGSNGSVDDEVEDDSTYNTHKAGSASKTPRTPKNSKAKQPRKKAASREELLASHREESQSAQDLYNEWTKRKEHILNLLASPGYSVTPSSTTEPETTLPAYYPPVAVPLGYNLSMEQGLYVFSPTAGIFREFSKFLECVENIAGRVKGVVKVIVPNGCVQPHPQAHTDSSKYVGNLLSTAAHLADAVPHASKFPSNLQAYKLNMILNENTRSDTAKVYDVRSEPTSNVTAASWRDAIEDHRKAVAKRWYLDEFDHADAWKNACYEETYSERKMIEDFANPQEDALYAMDNDAVNGLRQALRCADPRLVDYSGNSLMKSKSRIRGIHSPYFYVSRTEGTPFGMHIEDFAAYSLNYLHAGAPKCWKVVAPKDHAKLEEVMHAFLNSEERMLSSRKDLKPRRPPQCSQFLRHKSVYLPEELLQVLNIEFTSVVQNQGEMVITFPFAYHQGYNSGPNIAEAIGYASDRWEVFIREGLYENCQKLRCMVEPMKMDLQFAKTSRDLRRSSERIRSHKKQVKSTDVSPAAAYLDRQLRTRGQDQDSPPRAKPGVFPNIHQRNVPDESGKRTRSGDLKTTREKQDEVLESAQSSPEPPSRGRMAAKRRKVVSEMDDSPQLRYHLQGLDIYSPGVPRRAAGNLMEVDPDSKTGNDHHHGNSASTTAPETFNTRRRPSHQHVLQRAGEPRTQSMAQDNVNLVRTPTNEQSQQPPTRAFRPSALQQPPQTPFTPSSHNDDEHYLTLLAHSRPFINKSTHHANNTNADLDTDLDADALYQSWTATDEPTETELLAATANILKTTRRGPSAAPPPPPLQMPTPAGSSGNASDSSPGGLVALGGRSRDSSVESRRRGGSSGGSGRGRTQTPDYSTPWGFARSVRKR